MRYISLFSGIEAASVAWGPLGWTPVAFSEIDPFASAVLAYHWPDVPNHGDVTAFDWSQYRGKCDVVIGGSPCTSFSLAGLRKSLDDPRGQLTLAFARACNDIDPPLILWENVPSVRNTHDNVFGHFLAGLVGESEPLHSGLERGKWPDAGMVIGPQRAACWGVLDAAVFGVPQRRRRIFCLAVAVSHPSFAAGATPNPAPVLLECAGREGRPPEGGTSRKKARRPARGGTPGGGGLFPDLFRDDVTVAAGDNLDAIPEISAAVTAKWAKGVGGPAGDECQHLVPVAFSVKDHGADAGEVAPTLRAMGHAGSHANGGGQIAVVTVAGDVTHALRAEGADASEDGTGRGTPLVAISGDDAPECLSLSIRGREGGLSAEILPGNAAHALRASQGGSDKPHVLLPNVVRRLTPLECSRLQGFPDGHTLIPYGRNRRIKDLAEMAEYWGVSEETAKTLAADSVRYKAIGNSMAVPVIWWIGRRIEWVLRKLAERDGQLEGE